MKKYVLLVGGGSGSRMGTEIPKQFIPILGKPIIMHAIERFYEYSMHCNIIAVIPEDYIGFWEDLCEEFDFNHKIEIVKGGPTRFQSVKNGLKQIIGEGLVSIHDAARPLVSRQTIETTFNIAEKLGNAIPVVPVADSLREINQFGSFPANRDCFRIIQTPQCFNIELIKKAYELNFEDNFTDDASVLEAFGEKINLVEGNLENIKITFPADIKIATALLQKL